MRINFKKKAWPVGYDIPECHQDKTGDSIISEHTRSQLTACIKSHINPFLRYMDVNITTRNAEEVLRDHNVLMHFAEYLTENRILTCNVYYWKMPAEDADTRGNWDFTRRYVAIGLDIKEDELYTLQSLKT